MNTAKRLLALSVLASGALFTTSAFACSSSEWSTTAAGATPGDPSMSIARVAGKCGLEVINSGSVVDNTPESEATFIARFYFFGKNLPAGVHAIFSAYSADGGTGTNHLTMTYDGTNIAVETSAGSGNTASAAALSDKWNLVEFKWESGGQGSLWVNADASTDAASGTFTSGTGSIGSAKLGAVSALASGSAFFDDYVSHRSLPVGPALIGDSNNDGQVNGLDIAGVLQESNAFTPVLQSGTPDCNLDGAVNGLDISGVLKASDAFNPTPCG